MSRLTSFGMTAVSSAISWIVYYLVMTKASPDEAVFMASALLCSILLHEIGHAVMMERSGIRAHVIILVILGGAFPADPKKIEKLPWSRMAGILLAGVTMNAIVGLSSILLVPSGILTVHQAQVLASMNGSLIIWNLVPWSILDGGRFAKLFFDSIPEHLDIRYYSRIAPVIMASAIALMVLVGDRGFFTPALLVMTGLAHRATNDDPQGSHNPLAMRLEQIRMWSGAYIGLFLLGLCLIILNPR